MAKCQVCGNDYDKSFEVTAAGARHTFDSFECAIQAMAPVCEHCDRTRSRGQWPLFLLCALCENGHRLGCERPGSVIARPYCEITLNVF